MAFSAIGRCRAGDYDWSEIDDYPEAGIFPVIPEAGLRATLGILARTVE
ncbi:hypothetical protein ACFXPM_03255 [Streptomyces sp. NPDC059095]